MPKILTAATLVSASALQAWAGDIPELKLSEADNQPKPIVKAEKLSLCAKAEILLKKLSEIPNPSTKAEFLASDAKAKAIMNRLNELALANKDDKELLQFVPDQIRMIAMRAKHFSRLCVGRKLYELAFMIDTRQMCYNVSSCLCKLIFEYENGNTENADLAVALALKTNNALIMGLTADSLQVIIDSRLKSELKERLLKQIGLLGGASDPEISQSVKDYLKEHLKPWLDSQATTDTAPHNRQEQRRRPRGRRFVSPLRRLNEVGPRLCYNFTNHDCRGY